MRVRKRISKRVNTRQRNRIQKKVSEHNRKARKIEKKSKQWKSKKPKDLGIPNSFPFKEQVLAELEETRRRREEEKKNKRKEKVNGNSTSVNGNGQIFDEGVKENGYAEGIQLDSDDEIIDDEVEEDESDDEDDEVEEMETSESEWEGIQSEKEVSVEELTRTNTKRNSKVIFVKS